MSLPLTDKKTWICFMALSDASEDRARLRVGIVLMIAAVAVAALSGALMKTLSSEMSPLMVAWFRFAGFFVIMLPFAVLRAGWRAFRPPRFRIQVVRGLLLGIGNILFLWGVVGLDYADAIAILYVYPFLMVLMAPAVLGERVSPIAWLGVFGGFAGVLLVIRPQFGDWDVHGLMVLGTGFTVALQMLMNRKLGVLADPAVISLWGAMVAAVLLTFALPFVWVPFDMAQWDTLVLLAVTSAASQTLMILSMARAPASDLAPFTYSEIAIAVLLGLVMFGTLPDLLSWLGIGLITLCGIVVAMVQGRMTLRRQPKI